MESAAADGMLGRRLNKPCAPEGRCESADSNGEPDPCNQLRRTHRKHREEAPTKPARTAPYLIVAPFAQSRCHPGNEAAAAKIWPSISGVGSPEPLFLLHKHCLLFQPL